MPPRRAPWADATDDSEPDDLPILLARTPPLRLPPFGVFLSAYLRGLGVATVSRRSMEEVQRVLQTHPRAAVVLGRSRLWDIVFYVSIDPQVKAQHVIDYLIALHSGNFTFDHLRIWLLLLQIESYVDFSSPDLNQVLYPGCELPAARPAQ